MQKVDKKWSKQKYIKKRNLFIQLYQFGYTDYDKNLKAIDKNKEDINLILNNMGKYYK